MTKKTSSVEKKNTGVKKSSVEKKKTKVVKKVNTTNQKRVSVTNNKVTLDNKKTIFMAVCLVCAAFMGLLAKFGMRDEYKSSNCEYMLHYDDGLVPGAQYDVCVTKTKKVYVTKTSYCSTKECVEQDKTSTVEKTKVNFSNKNKKYIDEFVDTFFDDEKEVTFESTSLYALPYEKANIFYAIISNNEEYLGDNVIVD